jgi:hypothetical protein
VDKPTGINRKKTAKTIGQEQQRGRRAGVAQTGINSKKATKNNQPTAAEREDSRTAGVAQTDR